MHAEPGQRRGPKGRQLTFAEKKVNWDSIEAKINQLEESFTRDAQALLQVERDKFVKALTIAAVNGDTDKIKSLQLRIRTEYKALIKENLKTAYEYGKGTAAKEMDVPPPPTPNEMARNIDLHAEAIAERHLSQMENEAKLSISDAMLRDVPGAAAAAAVAEKLTDLAERLVKDTGGIVMAGFINNGRQTTFDANEADIYALQRSEVLDARTCNYCLSVDARIIEKTDPFGKVRQFHTHCRGIWVEILVDEEQKPEISGIPKTLRDRFGGDVNDLIQPKKPITKENSLARAYVLRRRKR